MVSRFLPRVMLLILCVQVCELGQSIEVFSNEHQAVGILELFDFSFSSAVISNDVNYFDQSSASVKDHLRVPDFADEYMTEEIRGKIFSVFFGDVNRDGQLSMLDLQSFNELLLNGEYQVEADINKNGTVEFSDVEPLMVLLLAGG